MVQSTVEYTQRDVTDRSKRASISVLHVDDEVGFLKAAKRIMEMQGPFKVDTASSVEEAEGKLKKRLYDVIISDYVMPGKDGLEFLKELRDSGDNTPFIVFTGKGREEVAIKALNLGADRYMNKVGDPETVYHQLTYAIFQVVDVKRALKMVRESEQRFRCLVEDAAVAIGISDTRGRFTYVNTALADLLGYSKSELIGHSFKDYLHPKDRGRIVRLFLKSLLLPTKPRNIEFRVIRKDGQIVHLESKPTRFAVDGKTVGFQAIMTNITERKNAEDELKESEYKFRSLLENAGDGILTLDLSGRVTSANKKIEEISGFNRDEIIGKRPTQFARMGILSLKDIPSILKALKTRIEDQPSKVFEVRFKNKKGKEKFVEIRGSLIKRNGKPVGILEIIRDITERKKAEARVSKSETKYRNIVELAPDGIATMNMKGFVTSVNSAFLRLTGFSEEEIVGKHFTRLGTLRTRDIPKYMKLIASILRGKIPGPLEFAYLHKNGTQHWGEAHMSLIRDQGKKTGLQAILRDTTEHKKILEKLERMNEKLQVVGQLTRHDARNKLSTITLNIFAIKRKLDDYPEIQEKLIEVESATKQIEKIFDFARIYEKLGAEELVYIDVEQTLKDTLQLFQNLHSTKTVNDCHRLTVLADSLLRQLFYNLIDNSLKHGEKVSRVRLHYEAAGKDRLKLIYEDDGVGIPKAEKEKIFLEGYGKDSGYGLYLIRKMCEVYGWAVQETGKQGRGVQFTITIPRTDRDGKEKYRVR
ncbi:MAG: PAS domain S-box protein [Candidatus Bathyarchaeota archaeon]|jgi:PAS domain S-box-containing protein